MAFRGNREKWTKNDRLKESLNLTPKKETEQLKGSLNLTNPPVVIFPLVSREGASNSTLMSELRPGHWFPSLSLFRSLCIIPKMYAMVYMPDLGEQTPAWLCLYAFGCRRACAVRMHLFRFEVKADRIPSEALVQTPNSHCKHLRTASALKAVRRWFEAKSGTY